MYVNYTIVCVGMIKGYNKSQQTSRWTKSKDIISHNKHQGERNHNQYYIQMETIIMESHNKS